MRNVVLGIFSINVVGGYAAQFRLNQAVPDDAAFGDVPGPVAYKESGLSSQSTLLEPARSGAPALAAAVSRTDRPAPVSKPVADVPRSERKALGPDGDPLPSIHPAKMASADPLPVIHPAKMASVDPLPSIHPAKMPSLDPPPTIDPAQAPVLDLAGLERVPGALDVASLERTPGAIDLASLDRIPEPTPTHAAFAAAFPTAQQGPSVATDLAKAKAPNVTGEPDRAGVAVTPDLAIPPVPLAASDQAPPPVINVPPPAQLAHADQLAGGDGPVVAVPQAALAGAASTGEVAALGSGL